MSILDFKGYSVKEMSYQRNDNFQIKQGKTPVKLEHRLQAKNNVDGETIIVNLRVVVGSLENQLAPFMASCTVVGRFTYHVEEDETSVGLDTLVRNNCVAILYPYVRAIIATLTTSSNEFPGYNMPTINVAKALAQSQDDRPKGTTE